MGYPLMSNENYRITGIYRKHTRSRSAVPGRPLAKLKKISGARCTPGEALDKAPEPAEQAPF